MASEWRAVNNRLYRGDRIVGHGFSEEVAMFLAAAAEHYRHFLGDVAHIQDSNVEPEHLELFARKTQERGGP